MSKTISFETAISQLEEKVRQLESGSMSLDESIDAFEKAVSLVKICNQRLDSAERKVRILIESADGTITDENFELNGNEA